MTGNEMASTATHSSKLLSAVENIDRKNGTYKIMQCSAIDNATANTTQILAHGGLTNND